MHGHDAYKSFLSRSNEAAIRNLDTVLPHHPSRQLVSNLIGASAFPEWSNGVSPSLYYATISKPIREMIDRRGKSWRSWLLLACVGAVGGAPESMMDVLGMPELLHTGSLIIDDVEDNSLTRRGAPSWYGFFFSQIFLN